MAAAEIDGFDQFTFSRDGLDKPVYTTGSGPPVLVMHELPGLSAAAVGFARRLAARAFTVHLPLLFGDPLQDDALGSYRRLCVSREFANLQAGVSAPVTDWLRGLAGELSRRHGGSKVGAIGMCLTGAFAIPLVLEPCVIAPVAAQPGVPVSTAFVVSGIGRGPWMSQLNVSDDHLRGAARRLRDERLSLLAFRFSADRICPKERLDRLRSELGPCLEAHELDSGGPWRRWIRPPHATLTVEFDRAPDRPDEPTRVAFERLVAFLGDRLGHR